MAAEPRFLTCHIAGVTPGTADRYLADRGFAPGMVSFAIPDYGILFRCRASGNPVDLEFGAYFALLRFVKTRLAGEKVKAIKVLSSNPEFVFSFTGKGRHLEENEERKRLLREFGEVYTLAVGYVRSLDNRALVSAVDTPTMPVGASIALGPDPGADRRPSIRPFRRGVDL